MASCWIWITDLLHDECVGWLSCSLAWLIIGCKWGAGVSPCCLWLISGRVPSPWLPHADAPLTRPPTNSDEGGDRRRESGGILRCFHFHSRDGAQLKQWKSSYQHAISNTPGFLIPPKGRCFNAYLLPVFVRQGRAHFIPEQWSVELSDGFHVGKAKKGFRKKNNSLCIAYLKAPQSRCCSHKGPVKR